MPMLVASPLCIEQCFVGDKQNVGGSRPMDGYGVIGFRVRRAAYAESSLYDQIAVDDGWIRRGFLHACENSRCQQVVVDRRVFDENGVDDIDDSIFGFVWRSQE